jgi:NADH dehydrogenase
MKDIIIVGGGFAGTWAALAAAKQVDEQASDIQITVISTDRYLTIRPRLYEPDPQALRLPLASTLEPVGVALLEGLVTGIDTEARNVTFDTRDDQANLRQYDRLILTAGSVQKPLPVPGSTDHTWNIDSFAAAVALDEHLQHVAQQPDSPGNVSIVIVGAGFTGLELATEMRNRLAVHSDAESAARARIVLIEQSDVIGPDLGQNPRPEIESALRSQNIEVHTATTVAEFRHDAVMLSNGDEIETTTAIVTAGMRANPLVAQLHVDVDELGRLPVDETLHVRDIPGVFAAGDVARAYTDDSHVALMSCQHAMPMRRFAGYNAARELMLLPLQPYRQPDYVTCLDLGAAGAVFTRGWDREIVLRDDAAKSKKRMINTERIYPPTGERDAILAMAAIDPRPAL